MTKNKPKPFLCYKLKGNKGRFKIIAVKLKTDFDLKLPPDAIYPAKVFAVNCVAAKVIYNSTKGISNAR